MADTDPAQSSAGEEQSEAVPEPAQADEPATPDQSGDGGAVQPDVRYQE